MDAEQTFLTCVTGISDAVLQARLVGAAPDIDAEDTRYTDAVVIGTLSRLTTFDLTTATVGEMSDVYENRMVKNSSPGRPIYNALRARSRGICPLCGHRTVATLDHYLPKRPHSALAVNPHNLIPCCWECNHKKGQFQPATRAEELLHPYFDNVEGRRWLVAHMPEQGPPEFEFLVQPPPQWPPEFGDRIQHHFDKLGLQVLYRAQTVQELANIQFGLGEILDAAGTDEVREHLKLQARSRSQHRLNSWQAAMYRAMAASDWFCGGAFRAGVDPASSL